MIMPNIPRERLVELKRFAGEIRKETVKEISVFGTGHIGGSLSIADVLAVLYGEEMQVRVDDPRWEGRDWFALSKGHCAPALYATLALKGFFPKEWLATLNQNGTNLPSHADRLKVPGVDITAGSLGQGVSVAAGVAAAMKMNGKSNLVYAIVGDGESQEGQVWEMALFAAQQRLDNLTVFVDYNKLQLDGFCADICDMGDMAAKFASFGWYAQNLTDGNDVEVILYAIERAKEQTDGKPNVIVLNTLKGLGWKDIEGQPKGHSTTISAEQRDEAIRQIDQMTEAEVAKIKASSPLGK